MSSNMAKGKVLEQTIFVTTDGEQYETRELAESHQRVIDLGRFLRSLSTLQDAGAHGDGVDEDELAFALLSNREKMAELLGLDIVPLQVFAAPVGDKS